MKTLFLLLPPAPVTASSAWAFLESPDGRHAGRFASATTSLLPRPGRGTASVVLVIPAQAVSWHRAQWPRTLAAGSSRLRAALEGMLEDELLDDPASLHLAIEPHAQAGLRAWVATLDRAWLMSAMDLLESQGLRVTRILPELLPASGSHPPLQIHAIAREGDAAHGHLLVSRPDGVQILPLGPGALPLIHPLPDDALCFAEPAVAADAESLLERPVLLQPTPQRWLAAAQSDWNLAQFNLARSTRRDAMRRLAQAWDTALGAPEWRPARWGLALAVLVQVLGLHAWAWREEDTLRQQQAGLNRLLQQTFPKAPITADPAASMEHQVSLLRRGTGEPGPGGLESLLALLAESAPHAQVSQIEFREGQLTVQGTPLEAASAGAALIARGLRAHGQGQALSIQWRDPA